MNVGYHHLGVHEIGGGTLPEYLRFMKGENGVFPLGVLRDDLKRNTNVILEKGAAVRDSRRTNFLTAHLKIVENAPKEVKAGQRYSIRVRARNDGDTTGSRERQ
jgi:hypothetical protein